MDKGKKLIKSGASNKSNNQMYMDLRNILREHALRYLPAKSLHRFIAVCRDWKFLISTPFFIHSQSCSFCSFSGLFCQSPGDPPSFISHDPTAYGVPDPQLKFLPEPVDVQTSSNGLLCCRGHIGEKSYYICNPVNQQWKKLPRPNAGHGSDPALVLVFEPSLLNFVADYKLICAYPSADFDDAYEFEVYSSVEDSWQICSEICFDDRGRRFLKKGGVHLNGVVYWLSNRNLLIAFDLNKNRSTVFHSDELGGTFTLGVVNGKLCASCKKGKKLTVCMLSNVYANTMHMQAESETWERKQEIYLDHDYIRNTFLEYEGSVVLELGSDIIVFHNGSRVFYYDMRTNDTTMLSTEVEVTGSCVYVPYVNSLVSLC